MTLRDKQLDNSIDFVSRNYRRGAFDADKGLRAIGFKRRAGRWSWQWSVAIIAVVLVGAGLWLHDIVTGGHDRVELENPDLLHITYTLPDSSRIDLSRGAIASYDPTTFASDRRVTLEGEAFFDVAHNEEKPFRVMAGTATVTVLGTQFNVNEIKMDSVSVSVSAGRVRLSNSRGNIVLTSGMEAVASRTGVEIVRGRLTVNIDVTDISLSQLSAYLVDNYNLRIANIPAEDQPVTMTFEGNADELEAIINSMLASEVRIETVR